jgi:small-conductance mechanosensitive channel
MIGKRNRAARPYLLRAATAGLVAFVSLVVASEFGNLDPRDPGGPRTQVALGGGLLLLVAGVVAVRSGARAIRVAVAEHAGEGRAATTALLATVIGYVLLVVAVLGALDVHFEQLLLGGALTGILLGIAAQQVLANFFAGIVLLAVRPFTVGELVVLRAGTLGAEYEGTVKDMGVFYVLMQTAQGQVALPNASVLASAIGPGARTSGPPVEPAPEAPPAQEPGGGQPPR